MAEMRSTSLMTHKMIDIAHITDAVAVSETRELVLLHAQAI